MWCGSCGKGGGEKGRGCNKKETYIFLAFENGDGGGAGSENDSPQIVGGWGRGGVEYKGPGERGYDLRDITSIRRKLNKFPFYW